MDQNSVNSDFFVAGGALDPEAACYVERGADQELVEGLRAGRLCYVFAPDYMGKTSLMLRTARRLQQEGVNAAWADLAELGRAGKIDHFYRSLIEQLAGQFQLSVDLEAWWSERAAMGGSQRFVSFLRDAVLPGLAGSVVILLDGMDAGLDRGVLKGLLLAIQSMYGENRHDFAYRRLSFALLGNALLSDLGRDHRQFLAGVGHRVELNDFTSAEAAPLQEGLQGVCGPAAEAGFSYIMYWTNGHPYLTQKMCLALAKADPSDCNNRHIDWLVWLMFLSSGTGVDPSLQWVEGRLKGSPKRGQLLACYGEVYQGQRVTEGGRLSEQERLKLMGLVRVENGLLKVRNDVYRLAFNLDWIKANRPFNWLRPAVVIPVVLVLVLAAAVVAFSQQKQLPAVPEQPRDLTTGFIQADTPEERLKMLAELFALTGNEDRAQYLFFEGLSPEEELALFELSDPQSMGEELVRVVQGVYTHPRLENSPHSNALLEAMSRALSRLPSPAPVVAAELRSEIDYWAAGRQAYNSQSQYAQAIEAFSAAIELNDRNPGTYFDRGLAYAGRAR